MSLLIDLVLFGLICYLINQYLFSYWTRNGFLQSNPKFLFGDGREMLTLKSSIGDMFTGIYNKCNEHRVFGMYMSYRPILLVNDPEIVQDILIKDFQKFPSRPLPADGRYDPLSDNLFHHDGQKWRDMRTNLSPTFSSGKVKEMFPVIKKCAKTLEEYLSRNLTEGEPTFGGRDVFSRYIATVVSSVAFGIDEDNLNDPSALFGKMSCKIFEPSYKNGVRYAIQTLIPKLFYKLRLKVVDHDVEDFVFSMVRQTVHYRRQNNLAKTDYLGRLIKLSDGYLSVGPNFRKEEKFSADGVAAGSFGYLRAAFETTSSTITFCMFELAKNPDIQKRVQAEIDTVLSSTGAEDITYETLSEMKYLECCIHETLRKYPISSILMRECNEDYKIPESDLIIPKGTAVFIPTISFHRDPEIYDEPMTFKPERFLKSATGEGKSKGLFYLPFGNGPRACMGRRMGILQVKIGIAMILSKFNFELSDKGMADQEIKFSSKLAQLLPPSVLRFNFSIRSA